MDVGYLDPLCKTCYFDRLHKEVFKRAVFAFPITYRYLNYAVPVELLVIIAVLTQCQLMYDFSVFSLMNVCVCREVLVVGLASISLDVISWQKWPLGSLLWKSSQAPGVSALQLLKSVVIKDRRRR